MAPKTAVDDLGPAPKRSKTAPVPTPEQLAEQAAKLAALEAAEAKKQDQRLLAATCSKPGATEAQKAMYAEYKASARFSAQKDELLKRFLSDKKCQWFQSIEQTKTDSNKATNSGLKGYGTRPFLVFVVSGKVWTPNGLLCDRRLAWSKL